MDFLAVLVVLLGAVATMPRWMGRMRSAKRKPGGGFFMGIGMMLMSVFDPPARDAMEQIDDKRQHGENASEESGAPPFE